MVQARCRQQRMCLEASGAEQRQREISAITQGYAGCAGESRGTGALSAWPALKGHPTPALKGSSDTPGKAVSEWSDTLKACKPHSSEATDTPWAQPAVQCRVITWALLQPKGKAQGSPAGHVAAFQKADLNKERASEGASSCTLVPCSTAPGVSKLWELYWHLPWHQKEQTGPVSCSHPSCFEAE